MFDLLFGPSSWVAPAVGIFGIFFGLITGYLNGRGHGKKFIDTQQLRKNFNEDLRNLQERVEELSQRLDTPGPDEYAWMVEEAYLRLKEESSTLLLEDLRQSYTDQLRIDGRLRRAEEQKEATVTRLQIELNSLWMRGNTNLAIGGAAACAGIYLLASFFIGRTSIHESEFSGNLDSFLIQFVPRLSLAVMTEVFAFFFLSLYKNSLNEMKYFQNEITSIEMKFLALEVAVDSDLNEHVCSVINTFARVERNFVLSKNQTTVELERARIEQAGRMDMTSKLADVFRVKNEK